MEEGQNNVHSGTILVGQGEEGMENKVSCDQFSVGETKDKVMSELSDIAGEVKFYQDCGDACKQNYEDLKNNMKRVWDLETEAEAQKLANTYYPSMRSKKQLEAEAQILRNLVQLSNGQYQTDLMWAGTSRPASNWEEAKKAFLGWEKRMEKEAKLKEAFHFAAQVWIEKDFINKTTIKTQETDPQYFLTCFMVLKEGQPIEKGRLVVNGARVFGGKCLNDYLEVGPNLMNDLSDILLLLQREKFVVCCDMQNMFLNIRVSPKDRKYLRLFYRPSPDQDLEVYEFAVHVFGLASSPCVAMKVVREHARRQIERGLWQRRLFGRHLWWMMFGSLRKILKD